MLRIIPPVLLNLSNHRDEKHCGEVCNIHFTGNLSWSLWAQWEDDSGNRVSPPYISEPKHPTVCQVSSKKHSIPRVKTFCPWGRLEVNYFQQILFLPRPWYKSACCKKEELEVQPGVSSPGSESSVRDARWLTPSQVGFCWILWVPELMSFSLSL